jgi:predicted esterase
VLARDPRVQGQRVALLGWSQGGLVAACVAARSKQPLATALWAAVADPVETFGGILGAQTVAAGLKTGDQALQITLQDKTIALKQGYFDGVITLKPAQEIRHSTVPLFVAHGRADTAVLPHAADLYLTAHKGKQQAWITDMDHSFNATQSPVMLDRMLDATAAFFKLNGLA